MSKEIELLDDIISATISNNIKWKSVRRGSYSDVIFQPNFVFRIYETIYKKDDDDYVVLLVEKKYDDPEWDFEIEKYKTELYFLYDREIVITIDDESVDPSELIHLARIIERNSDRARRLLG